MLIFNQPKIQWSTFLCHTYFIICVYVLWYFGEGVNAETDGQIHLGTN